MTIHELLTRRGHRGKDMESMVPMVETSSRNGKQSLPIGNDSEQTYEPPMDRETVLRHNSREADLGVVGGSNGLGNGGRDGGLEWTIAADGIFIKQIALQKGSLVPQHVHTYDHHSMLAKGAVTLFRGDDNLGVFMAPMPIFIRAGVQHSFLAMEDTLIYCIHNLHGQDEVDIIAEGKL